MCKLQHGNAIQKGVSTYLSQDAIDALVAALVEGKEAAGLLMSAHECHNDDCSDAQRYKRICAALKLAESPPTP